MPVKEMCPDVYQIQLRIPGPLRQVNTYLLRGAAGKWTLMDAGFFGEESQTGWQEAWAELGIASGDVEQIVVTHHHPDHVGGSGWLQRTTGAPVLMPRREIELAHWIWNPAGTQMGVIKEYLISHGVPPADLEAMADVHHSHQRQIHPLPEFTPIAPGQRLRLGRRDFAVVPAPGHTAGLAVYWCGEDGLLLANDMILEKITPNVGAWPNHSANPLGDFLTSLKRVGRLPATLTLTGHRGPVLALKERTAEIALHHKRRLRLLMTAMTGATDGISAWDLSPAIFGQQTNPQSLRFAVAETLSHLEYLRLLGRVERAEHRPIRYRLVDKSAARP